MKKITNKKNVIIVFAIVCIFCLVLLFFMGGNKEFKEHISLGNKYLQELNYEEAIVEFTAAFNLEPNNKEALKGIEDSCLAYADSILADVGNVEKEMYEKVSKILLSCYETTRIETIQSKVDDINQVIQEIEEKQAEEAAKVAEEEAKAAEKKAAEDAKKKEEEEKRKEEQAKKRELEEYYKWRVSQVLKGYLFYFDVDCKDNQIDYTLSAYGGASEIELIVFNLNKETEQAVCVEHWVEDFENGGMMDWSNNSNFVGKEYDFSSEEGMIIYREWVIEQERIEKYVDTAINQMIDHINKNWMLVKDKNVIFEDVSLYSDDNKEKERAACIHYISSEASVDERYYIEVLIDLSSSEIKIVECDKHKYVDTELLVEEIEFDFSTKLEVIAE